MCLFGIYYVYNYGARLIIDEIDGYYFLFLVDVGKKTSSLVSETMMLIYTYTIHTYHFIHTFIVLYCIRCCVASGNNVVGFRPSFSLHFQHIFLKVIVHYIISLGGGTLLLLLCFFALISSSSQFISSVTSIERFFILSGYRCLFVCFIFTLLFHFFFQNCARYTTLLLLKLLQSSWLRLFVCVYVFHVFFWLWLLLFIVALICYPQHLVQQQNRQLKFRVSVRRTDRQKLSDP